MSTECLTQPCSLCGARITGANWYYTHCNICVCFLRGITISETECPIKCPMCQRKLE